MVLDSWTIYWSEYTSDTYLYGSDVIFHDKKSVEFDNRLMPPGTVIKKWYSKTNYQLQMIEPTLPIIDGESSYRITVNIDVDEDEQFLGKFIFYNKYDSEVGHMYIRDLVSDFKCPLSTYSYEFQLINGGLTHFVFHNMVIEEITEDETDTESNNSSKRKAGKVK